MYIIHINDIHGFAEPAEGKLGYPRMAGFIRRFREDHPDTLVLDAGDAFAGSPLASFDRGDGILRILNTMGTDAMCAGNADFIYGQEHLLELAGKASFPILSANIFREDGETLLPGHCVLNVGGARVAVVGLTSLGSRNPPNGDPGGDSIALVRSLVARLRPEVDLVVVLSHLGDNPVDPLNSLRVAREVEGIDAIIDGHSHSLLPRGRVEYGVLIAQAGDFGGHLGIVELPLGKGAASARLLGPADLAAVPDLSDAPDCAAVLAAVRAKSTALFGQVVGSTAVFLNGNRDRVRTGESNAGNLLTDIMRDACGTDAALLIAGAVGGAIEPGEMTRGDLLSLVRVNAPLVTLEIRGADLEIALESMARNWPALYGGFFQVSGIRFQLGVSSRGRKVSDIYWGDLPLDSDKSYRVTVLSLMTAGPGLGNATTRVEHDLDLESAALAYLKRNSPVHPRIEGRMVISA